MTLLDLSIGYGRARSVWLFSSLAISAAAACDSRRAGVARDSAAGEIADTVEPQSPRLATDGTLAISSEGNIAAVTRTLSDSFATREAVQVRRDTTVMVESASSGGPRHPPDIVVLEDTALSHRARAPHATWYVGFAVDSQRYAGGANPVVGATDTTARVVNGRPIIHAISIPSDARNSLYAERFVRFLLSGDGKRILRAARLDPLDPPRIVGTGAPPAIVALITAAGGAPPKPHDPTARAP